MIKRLLRIAFYIVFTAGVIYWIIDRGLAYVLAVVVAAIITTAITSYLFDD